MCKIYINVGTSFNLSELANLLRKFEIKEVRKIRNFPVPIFGVGDMNINAGTLRKTWELVIGGGYVEIRVMAS